MPVVPCEAGVVFGVNDGEFASGEGDSAEGIAVAQAAMQKYKTNGGFPNQSRNVKDKLDKPHPQR